MTDYTLTVTVEDAAEHAEALGLLFPEAIDTPRQTALGTEGPAGWPVLSCVEKNAGQTARFAANPGNASGTPTVTYRFTDRPGVTDDTPFRTLWASPWSRPSDDLIREIGPMVDGLPPKMATRMLIDHTGNLFDYGHQDDGAYHEGIESVPVVACGLAKGSCVDINTYALGAMHVAQIPVQYFAGYFFPEERNGVTNDMHCWLTTWADGVREEWDIAHFKKMGLDEVQPAYNPKPGKRFALTYGRGLTFDVPGATTPVVLSHFSEPMWVYPGGDLRKARLTATLSPYPS